MRRPGSRSSSEQASVGSRRPLAGPFVVLIVSLAASALVAFGFEHAVSDNDSTRYAHAVEATRDRLERRLDRYIAALLATRGLFAARSPVTLGEFRRFTGQLDLQQRYPGLQGVGFSQRLGPDERPDLERSMQDQGQVGFHVWPDGARDELHSVVFVEPLDDRNRAVLGFDMYGEPLRRQAMARARDTGLPTASGKVTLAQDSGQHEQANFFIYVPVYRGGAAPTTVAERRSALIGFVYGAFSVEDLLAGLFSSEREPGVTFNLYDGPSTRDAARLHVSAGNEAADAPRFTSTETVSVAGHTWTLRFRTVREFESASDRRLLPWVMGISLLITGVLFLVSRAQARAHGTLRRQALDLTRMREAEHRARADAEAASRAKDEFLAMLGHELRNPLAPIVTALELLKHRPDTGNGRETDVIERQVRHLVRLVDDLLDVSRITRGKIVLDKQRVEMASVVGKAVEMASPLLEQQRHQLLVVVPPNGLLVEGDEVRLAQVIGNLLTNAAKYTDAGGRIEVSASRENGEVVLRVRDNGIGIAPEVLPRIFDLFTQGQRGLDRAQGGLGIGLTLVRALVAIHGGTVTAASDGLGRGSEFAVRLPAAPPRTFDEVPAAPAANIAALPLAPVPRRVLVVDDNQDGADLLADVLRAAGHEVDVAYDGPQAIDVARRFHPEVAVLDIGLPVMDGYELAARLREQLHPTLIAVTGYGQQQDRMRSRVAGFQLHLVKPVDPAALLAAIEASPRRANG